jgi:hypothetical protein
VPELQELDSAIELRPSLMVDSEFTIPPTLVKLGLLRIFKMEQSRSHRGL